MAKLIQENKSVTATTFDSATKYEIHRKNVVVYSQNRNTAKLYVGVAEDGNSLASDAFVPLGVGKVHFFSASKNHKIEFIHVYAAAATQYVDIHASDAALEPLTPTDYAELQRMEWLADGSYPERWEQGFRKKLYHGRTGAFFMSESAANTPFDDWTPPTILLADNTLPTEAAPYLNAISMKNSKNGVTVDPLYVGFPKSHQRMAFCFEGKLPAAAASAGQCMGFEVNSGLYFALGAMLISDGANWMLEATNYQNGVLDIPKKVNVTINNPAVYSIYALVYDPPFLELWQADAGTPTFQMKLTNTLNIGAIKGKAIPFFANEGAAITEFDVGNTWIYELPDIRTINEMVSQATSTAAFASALKIHCAIKNKILIQLHEHNTNDIQYKILASMDDVTYFTIVAATDLLTNGDAVILLSDPWLYIDVQIIDKAAGTHGKLDCTIGGN